MPPWYLVESERSPNPSDPMRDSVAAGLRRPAHHALQSVPLTMPVSSDRVGCQSAPVIRRVIRLLPSALLLFCSVAAANQYTIDVRADQNLNVRGLETVIWRNGGNEASTEISIVCACDIGEIV